MKFKELTVEQFAEYAKNHPQYNFLQNPYMVSSQIARNTEVHCVGLVDDQDQVVLGLSYYVRRMKRIFKLAYADLVFFNNEMDDELIDLFLSEFKKHLKKQRILKITIAPNLIKYTYQDLQDHKIDLSNLEEDFKRNGFIQQERVWDVYRLVNLMFIKDLTGYETEEELLKSFEPNLRRSITKGQQNGVVFEQLNKSNLDRFEKLESMTADRNQYVTRDMTYYETVYDNFAPSNSVLFMVAQLNLDTYRKKLNNEIEMGLSEIEDLESQENLTKKKLNRIKSIQEVVSAQQKRLTVVNDIKLDGEVDMAGVYAILTPDELVMLKAPQNEDFASFAPTSMLYFEAMKIALNRGIKKFNFYGTSDIDKPGSKGYQIYEYKKKFGGELFELIEPFYYNLSFLGKFL